MTGKTSYTNTDIMAAIQHMNVQNDLRFTGLEKRLDYTNGNVKDLLLWKSNTEAIQRYKDSQEAQPSPNPKASWNSILVWLVPLFIALASALVWLGGLGR